MFNLSRHSSLFRKTRFFTLHSTFFPRGLFFFLFFRLLIPDFEPKPTVPHCSLSANFSFSPSSFSLLHALTTSVSSLSWFEFPHKDHIYLVYILNHDLFFCLSWFSSSFLASVSICLQLSPNYSAFHPASTSQVFIEHLKGTRYCVKHRKKGDDWDAVLILREFTGEGGYVCITCVRYLNGKNKRSSGWDAVEVQSKAEEKQSGCHFLLPSTLTPCLGSYGPYFILKCPSLQTLPTLQDQVPVIISRPCLPWPRWTFRLTIHRTQLGIGFCVSLCLPK